MNSIGYEKIERERTKRKRYTTKFKVLEMFLASKRREIMTDRGLCVCLSIPTRPRPRTCQCGPRRAQRSSRSQRTAILLLVSLGLV